MKPKTPLKDQEKSDVIYNIECNDCDAHYVGETSKKLKSRANEHKLCVRRFDELSQIAQHTHQYNHTFNFNDAKVLAQASNRSARQTKESWFSDDTAINRHVNLHPSYQALRQTLVQKTRHIKMVVPNNETRHVSNGINPAKPTTSGQSNEEVRITVNPGASQDKLSQPRENTENPDRSVTTQMSRINSDTPTTSGQLNEEVRLTVNPGANQDKLIQPRENTENSDRSATNRISRKTNDWIGRTRSTSQAKIT
jgi:hypothetical protein